MLEDCGARCCLADNGKAAFDLLEHEQVELVLMIGKCPSGMG